MGLRKILMFPFGWNYARSTRAHLFLNISLLGRIIMLIIDEHNNPTQK